MAAGTAILVGAALCEKMLQMEQGFIAKHGGNVGKAIASAVEKVCVVCGAKSHRLDWQVQDAPACDNHLQEEHDAAKAALASDPEKAKAYAQAQGIQTSISDMQAKQLAGPEKPMGVSVQTPASAAAAKAQAAQKPASPTDVVKTTPAQPKPASLQPPAPPSQTKPAAPAPAPASPAPVASETSPTAKKVTTDATQPIQPAAPAGEPEKKA